MKRKKVVSSNISSIGYDKDKTLLEIEFYNLDVFQYHPVDENTYKKLINAESIGKEFIMSIKNNKSIRHHKME